MIENINAFTALETINASLSMDVITRKPTDPKHVKEQKNGAKKTPKNEKPNILKITNTNASEEWCVTPFETES